MTKVKFLFMKKIVIIVLMIIYFNVDRINSQCVPAASDDCESAAVLCSLDELNGYTCSTRPDFNPTACLPCNGQGTANNSSWWAFVSEGGNIVINVNYGGCTNPYGAAPSGMQMGLVGGCDCSHPVSCHTNCNGSSGSFTITGFLVPCKTYFFWVNGCNGDECNFTISTSGGGSVRLNPLGAINSSAPNPICKGCCSNFTIASQPGGCTPEYVWTVDGNHVGDKSTKLTYCFPDEGIFRICVFAVLGNYTNGAICSQTAEKCISFQAKKREDQIARPLTLCSERIPFDWHCESVGSSGTYRCPFTLNNCCEYDSVIDITVLERVKRSEVFYIGCKGEQYIDTMTNMAYGTCNNKTEIYLPRSTKDYQCDSFYFLNTIYPDAEADMFIYCKGSKTILEMKPKITTVLCGLTPDIQERVEWYELSQSQTILDTNFIFYPKVKGDYCVRYLTTYSLGNQKKTCSFEFCEKFDETQFLVQPNLSGNLDVKNGSIENYKAVGSTIPVLKYLWRVEGGSILDSFTETKDSIFVKWNSAPDTLAKICLDIESDCSSTGEICLDVKLNIPTVIETLTRESVKIIPNPNDGNFIIYLNESIQYLGLQLMTSDGREIDVLTLKQSKNQIQVQTSKIDPGIYQLNVKTNKGMISKSVVIF
jgi:hypothetical protein